MGSLEKYLACFFNDQQGFSTALNTFLLYMEEINPPDKNILCTGVEVSPGGQVTLHASAFSESTLR